MRAFRLTGQVGQQFRDNLLVLSVQVHKVLLPAPLITTGPFNPDAFTPSVTPPPAALTSPGTAVRISRWVVFPDCAFKAA